MKQGTQLLTGYSGAGKSSLINALFPELQAATGAISAYSGKGTHTTTAATLYETGPGTAVIDSPGIKEWGILDLQPYEIAYHFREIREIAPACRFPNCSHSHEPSCAVQEAVKEGRIHSERFLSYLSILANDNQYN
jgi:ribosome biogenesis GTPase